MRPVAPLPAEEEPDPAAAPASTSTRSSGASAPERCAAAERRREVMAERIRSPKWTITVTIRMFPVAPATAATTGFTPATTPSTAEPSPST